MTSTVRFGAVCAALVLAGAVSTEGQARAPRPEGNAVVAGRVTNQRGEPVAGVFVTLLRRNPRLPDVIAAVNATLGATTGSSGEFRIDQRAAGDYYVVASPLRLALAAGPSGARSDYGVTYFPGTADVRDATPVSVAADGTTEVDIRLLEAPWRVIRGNVVACLGRRFSGGLLRLSHAAPLFALDSQPLEIRSDSTFEALVPPGTYVLGTQEGPARPAPPDLPRLSRARVTVGASDLTNVLVLPLEPVLVRGRVTVAPNTELPSGLTVIADPEELEGPLDGRFPGTIREDLSFEFGVLTGRWRVVVRQGTREIPAIVRLNGYNITNTFVDFKGALVTGLEIEMPAR